MRCPVRTLLRSWQNLSKSPQCPSVTSKVIRKAFGPLCPHLCPLGFPFPSQPSVPLVMCSLHGEGRHAQFDQDNHKAGNNHYPANQEAANKAQVIGPQTF